MNYMDRESARCEDCGSPCAITGGGLPNFCSEHFRKRNLKAKPSDTVYCEARGRRQAEARTWGASHVGCGNKATQIVTEDGRAYRVCRTHVDPNKRYGWNA